MRLYFTLSPNTEPVSFDYQHRLTGVFHKWLKENSLHDRISLYSLSWLDGGFARNGSLHFPNGAKWFVSFYEEQYAERLVNGALFQPEMFGGMRVLQIEQKKTPDFGTKYKFKVASPVFIKGKRPEDGTPPHHYLFNEPESDALLTATLRHKMDEANLADQHKTVKVAFDREFQSPKTKKVNIEKFKDGARLFIEHKASVCPVIVEGTPEAVRFAWNVGIGNGTGSCFGSLKENTENA
ncbi:MAG: CRISPR-associated endoribonuclease Cas6 [Acidobacteria bacterium]|nr:CRISPR-associated endoribonuclease Cas6 [Acidobacteriota bacterium]